MSLPFKSLAPAALAKTTVAGTTMPRAFERPAIRHAEFVEFVSDRKGRMEEVASLRQEESRD
jgi:hypothetical protein